jgi:predicted dehydrogenase
MNKVRLAVIGVGHLGRIHARLVSQTPTAELIGIVDPVTEAREAVAAELNVPVYADHRPLLSEIDAAIVAIPSQLHFAVAHDLLVHGKHVLVEKPMTLNVGDAGELVAEAAKRGLVLHVGHVERFNPAFVAAGDQCGQPKYIDAVREGPYSCRSTDIGAVLDLMIHDIDAVLSLVEDEVASVEALGAAVIGPNEDWAQARLTFAGGCIANLWASRVAWQAQRQMKVVSRDCATLIDFGSRQAKVMRPHEALANHQFDINSLSPQERSNFKERLTTDYLPVSELKVTETNALVEEQRAFVTAIQGKATAGVSGTEGRRALDVAERILADIALHRWDGAADGAVGPRFETRQPLLRGPHWQMNVPMRKAG